MADDFGSTGGSFTSRVSRSFIEANKSVKNPQNIMEKKEILTSVMVVGVGRSGTSLLQSMLAAHSKISFPPETVFLRRYVAKGRIAKTYKREGRSGIQEILRKDEYFQRTGLEPAILMEKLAERNNITDGDVYREMLKLFAENQKKNIIGDKDPRSIEFLKLVFLTLVKPCIVHVIRDPRDVLASKKVAAWSRGHGAIWHIFANRVQIKMGRYDGLHLFKDRYFELIYEKLLLNPEVELRRLCNFLGLEYEPAMIENFGESAKRLVSEKEMAWKKETLGPLLKKNINKWKNSLSIWETALVELVCREHFVTGKYEKSGCIMRLSFVRKLSVYALAVMIMVIDPFYRFYRRFTILRALKYS